MGRMLYVNLKDYKGGRLDFKFKKQGRICFSGRPCGALGNYTGCASICGNGEVVQAD